MTYQTIYRSIYLFYRTRNIVLNLGMITTIFHISPRVIFMRRVYLHKVITHIAEQSIRCGTVPPRLKFVADVHPISQPDAK